MICIDHENSILFYTILFYYIQFSVPFFYGGLWCQIEDVFCFLFSSVPFTVVMTERKGLLHAEVFVRTVSHLSYGTTFFKFLKTSSYSVDSGNIIADQLFAL